MGNDYLEQAKELQEKLQALLAEQSEYALERARLIGLIARAEKDYTEAVASFEMWATEQNLLTGSNDATRKQNRANAFELYKLDERWQLDSKRRLLESFHLRDQELQVHLIRLHETLTTFKLQVNLLDMQMAYDADLFVPTKPSEGESVLPLAAMVVRVLDHGADHGAQLSYAPSE